MVSGPADFPFSSGAQFTIGRTTKGFYSHGQGDLAQLLQKDPTDLTKPPPFLSSPTLITEKILSNFPQATIVCGYSYVLAIISGEAYGWGYNVSGCLGVENKPNERVFQTPIKLPPPPEPESTWRKFFSGWEHSVGITSKGTAFVFGMNNEKQIVDLVQRYFFKPHKIPPPPSGGNWIDCCCGRTHTIMIADGGIAFAWGDGKKGQLANGSRTTPITCPNGSHWVKFYSRGNSTIGMTATGEAFAFGENSKGQLGLKDTQDRNVPTLLATPDGSRWREFFCGEDHMVGITENLKAFVWGSNKFGQLGLGRAPPPTVQGEPPKEDNVLSPQPLASPGPLRWSTFSCQSHGTIGITQDGTVYVWGRNDKGQLGLGDTIIRLSPTLLPPPPGSKWDVNVRSVPKDLTHLLTSRNYADDEISGVPVHRALIAKRCRPLLETLSLPNKEQLRILLRLVYGGSLESSDITKSLMGLFYELEDHKVENFRMEIFSALKQRPPQEILAHLREESDSQSLWDLAMANVPHITDKAATFKRNSVIEKVANIQADPKLAPSMPFSKWETTPLGEDLLQLGTSDFSLKAFGISYPIERFTLVENQYFQQLFHENQKEAVVDLLSPSALEKLLRYLTSGTVPPLTAIEATEILLAKKSLHLNNEVVLLEVCDRSVTEDLSDKNCFEVFKYASDTKHKAKDGAKELIDRALDVLFARSDRPWNILWNSPSGGHPLLWSLDDNQRTLVGLKTLQMQVQYLEKKG